jgi:glyoxylase-like metal-dependent hydrolase (beta-lactamase superfamily II)
MSRWRATAGLASLVATLLVAPQRLAGESPAGDARAEAREAARLLDRALAPYAALAEGERTVLEAAYEGTLDLEGHYRRPHETRPMVSRQRFLTDGRGHVRLDWTRREPGDDAGATESTLVLGGRVLQRASEDAPWKELSGVEADDARYMATLGLPVEFAREARANAAEARVVSGRGDVVAAPLCGALRSLRLDGGRVATVERVRADTRLGDVLDRVAYEGYSTQAGVPLPAVLQIEQHESDSAWRLDAKLAEARRRPLAPGELDLPPGLAPAAAARAVRVERLAAGVFALVLEDVDLRALAVEAEDHLILLETGLTGDAGERLVDALRERFPHKPIRYALFGHYHPHYTGGLRAAIDAGATIVVAPGNEAYVREIAARRFALAPDRLARSGRALRVEVLRGRREFGRDLVALDIGTRSNHTDEYLVFYVPRARLLYQGDLGWFTRADGTRVAGSRAAGLLEALDAAGLEVERLVQSWPVAGNAAEISMAELRQLVAARQQKR